VPRCAASRSSPSLGAPDRCAAVALFRARHRLRDADGWAFWWTPAFVAMTSFAIFGWIGSDQLRCIRWDLSMRC
jgi:hypothetical protein